MTTSATTFPADENSQQADKPPKNLWRNLDFVLLWGGQAVSALGSSISDIALGLLAFTLTHSAAQVAYLASIEALPFFFLALPAGAWIDRWNRKRVMFFCDLGRAICLGSIALALFLGHLTLVQLYIVALIEGSLATLFTIAGMAGLPQIVPKQQLGGATSATYVSSSTASLIGPPLGSFTFALNSSIPFVADAFSYFISVISIFWIKTDFQVKRQRNAKSNVFRDLIAGFVWMIKQPVLCFQALAGCILSLALYPITPLAIALSARLHAPEASIGLIFTIGSLGGLLAGFIAPLIQRKLRFGIIISGMFTLLAFLFLGYTIAPTIVWVGVILSIVSLVQSIGSIANISYRLALTPDEYQGRVNSIHRFVGYGIGRPLGAVLLGMLLARTNATFSVFVFATILIIFALITLLYTPVRTVQRLNQK